MKHAALALVLLLAAVGAGCTDGEQATVVIDSRVVELEPTTTTEPPKSAEVGHIAGYVVDPRFHTLEGVVVALPGYDLEDPTDRKGEFSFVDLPAGSYLLEVTHEGYEKIRTTIDVTPGKFVRLQIILHPLPPEEPVHVTWKFEGTAPVTKPPTVILQGSSIFTWEHPPEGLHTLIVEAFMDRDVSGNGFQWTLHGEACCERIARGESTAPMYERIVVNGTDAAQPRYELRIYPTTFVPEVNVHFEVFVTAFFNGPAPDDWSIATQP